MIECPRVSPVLGEKNKIEEEKEEKVPSEASSQEEQVEGTLWVIRWDR